MRQDVIDDIVVQLEYEKNRYHQRAKTYEQLRHDLILWHIVSDKRPARVESPVEATYWIVTVDYHFLAFDLFKRSALKNPIPICLHPTSLIQLLQFWLPRTRQFEEAILDSLRLPLLFQDFDLSAERVTVKILETLGRFEKVDQLSKEIVGNILVNEALRHQIAAEPDVQKQIDLVHGALVEENQKALSRLDAVSEEKQRLASQITEKDKRIEELEAKLEEHEDQITHLKLQEATQISQKATGAVPAAQKQTGEDHSILFFALAASTLLALALVSSSFLMYLSHPTLGFWRVASVVWGVIFIIWILCVDQIGKRSKAVRSWLLFRKLDEFKSWLFALLALVIGWQIIEWIGKIAIDWLKRIAGA
jgi:hypothetical protein